MFRLVNESIDVRATNKDWREEDWRVVDIHVPDVTTTNNKQSASGAPGSTFLGSDTEDRENISILFDFYIDDIRDYEAQKSEIFRMFNTGPMRLYVDYIGNDRYLEVVKENLVSSRIGHRKGRMSLELSTINLPYFTGGQDVQEFTDVGVIEYENMSHIDLDNRYTDTEIKIELSKGTSGDFLELVIDGKAWRYNKAMTDGQSITIRDGAAYIGNNNVIGDTTKNVLVIPTGISEMIVRGAEFYTMTVTSKLYYY